jgi:hypothetical protein
MYACVGYLKVVQGDTVGRDLGGQECDADDDQKEAVESGAPFEERGPKGEERTYVGAFIAGLHRWYVVKTIIQIWVNFGGSGNGRGRYILCMASLSIFTAIL